jgi:hypothetical protein
MELIERPNFNAVLFLKSITFEQFKNECINEAEERGEKPPPLKDIKTWYSILMQFCKTNIKTKGITKRIYSYSLNTPAGLGGRLFSGGSLQSIWSPYRGLLMNGIGTDIDMQNAHPVILRYVCHKYNIQCPELEYYINNRDESLEMFESRAIGKNAYLCATNNDVLSRRQNQPPRFRAYDREMKRIQKELVTRPEYRGLCETIPEYKASQNYNGCAINRILCYYENIILGHAIHLVNSLAIEIAILMFDGLMVYGDFYNSPELLQDIQTYVNSKMPDLNMKWSYKYHDNSIYIPDDFNPDDVAQDPYSEWKEKFESEYCKIKNQALFIRKYEQDGKTHIILQKEPELVTAWKHESYVETDDKGKDKRVSFIDKWLKDGEMRCYDDTECIPPPLVCPPNIFNLWTPSPYESQPITKDDPDFDMTAMRIFAQHIKTLCGNDLEVYQYVCGWIAHSIQKPAEKFGVALNFISAQGIGKNIFTDTLGQLYGGKSKVLDTAQPERDVWGDYSELMINAYVVVLSEVGKQNFHGTDGRVKKLITDTTVPINPKGKTKFIMNSYHRYILLTNDIDPVVTSEGDRRNVIIRCSDENKGDTEYFTTLIETLRRPHALRSIYWSFRTMDIHEMRVGDLISTSYHKDIISYNENPLRTFILWFIDKYTDDEVIELSAAQLMSDFTLWKHDHRFKFGDHMNSSSLVKKMRMELLIPEEHMSLRKSKYHNVRMYNITALKRMFKVPIDIDSESELLDQNTGSEY